MTPRSYDLAHLAHQAHVELLSPRPEARLDCLVRVVYVCEPDGNRFEVCNAGARLILAPDWRPIVWTEAERRRGQARGLQTIAPFHTHGTPSATPEVEGVEP
jgi:hypothetical protein